MLISLFYGCFDFYPRSPCGERLSLLRKITITVDISIHALLAESDRLGLLGWLRTLISIHALLAESDTNVPAWPQSRKHFYPRSPCGERLISEAPSSAPYAISIHALLAESDGNKCSKGSNDSYFYPRSPCGERPPITLRHCTTYLFLSTLSLRRATPRGGKLLS